MSWFKAALSPHIDGLFVRGYSDLCLGDKKIMGTAQRRLRRCILFHGSLLVSCDLSLISTYLSHPSKEPGYRQGRDHSAFLTNAPLSLDEVEAKLADYFVAFLDKGHVPDIDAGLISEKIASSYALLGWNFKL
jgi:lipoate---protein ligase